MSARVDGSGRRAHFRESGTGRLGTPRLLDKAVYQCGERIGIPVHHRVSADATTRSRASVIKPASASE
jgi:hypothetical protein